MTEELRILIVDDEEDLAEIVSESLEDNFNSSFVTCAQKAFELFENGEVDVIISDAHMPGMSGMDLLDKIGQSSRNILFYLATGDIAVTEKMIIDKGGHGIFEKPFSPKQVIGRIKEDFKKI